MKTALALVAVIGLTWPAIHAAAAAPAAQGPLVPKPFPGSSPSRPAEPPRDAPSAPAPAPVPAAPQPETEIRPEAQAAASALEGVPLYPSAELIDQFDAGMGQRYYLYGTNAPYVTIVSFYRDALNNGGRELYRDPPMRQFDLGRFDQGSMAYPPSVVVKDYASNGPMGFLAVSGTSEKRYRTVIQIVPASAPAQ